MFDSEENKVRTAVQTGTVLTVLQRVVDSAKNKDFTQC